MNKTHKTLIIATNVSLGIGGEHADCFVLPVRGGLAIFMGHTLYELEVFIDDVIAFGTIGGSNIEIFTTPHVLPYSLTINNTVCSHAQPLVGEGLYFFNGWQFGNKILSNRRVSISKIFILNSKFTDNKVRYGGGFLINLKAGGYSLIVSN